MKSTITLSALALFAASTAQAQTPADLSDLTVSFAVGAQQGQIMVALFPSQADYEGDKSLAARVQPVGAETVSVTFPGLPPGRYAVKSFHDVNGDGRMNSNIMGVPTEPVGFSNNAPIRMGPPSWDAAAFDVKAGGGVHTITLR